VSKNAHIVSVDGTFQKIFNKKYGAPERFERMESPSDFLMDSWSLGLVFYQICTDGEFPFKITGISDDKILDVLKND
jgi:serine/threonine protein kinase